MFGGRFKNVLGRRGSREAIWRIFSSNISAQANMMGGFYTSCLPKKEEIGGIVV
jgi:hypothetical protein